MAYWAKAKTLFERHGMHSESAKITQAIGRAKIADGDVEEGLQVLLEAEAVFETFEMLLDAIDVSQEINETIIANGGEQTEVLRRCKRDIARAQRAGLGMQVSIALAHLRRAAAGGGLDIEYVRHVRAFVRDAKANPGAEFRPPLRNLR